MTENFLTRAARRHISRMLRALAPFAPRLERSCRSLLRQRAYNAAQIRAFLAITPGAASRLRTLNQFMEQVAYNGRRLARLNVPPPEVSEVLRDIGAIFDPLLTGRFEPAREQLHLAVVMTLNRVYYEVREAEVETFFGLYRAEREASDLDDLL